MVCCYATKVFIFETVFVVLVCFMANFQLLNFRNTDRSYCELRIIWNCKAKVTLLLLPYYVLGITENYS